jgi:DNA polymerase III subunit gamma/tau
MAMTDAVESFSSADIPANPRPTEPYRVLARKYRPRSFEDLIGQEAMVRTLANAFASGRIPQAWMLTGVRGVGKTTTARILARGLNFEHEDGSGAPTVELAQAGRHCQAIMEGRHIDIMEIDAASHNGVDNIRQINDAVRYTPVSARYKVYIVDEVHMLSTGAFNAFLKTLEEPPPHAKFIFATTEIRKVPVTILSRCQRFDLRRVEASVLIAHLQKICALEAVTAEPEALQLIARAAEGSVRDALSLLDQAISHGAGHVTAGSLRQMLGLADRSLNIDLFEAVMKGEVAGSFAVLRRLFDAGADPALILSDLAGFAHLVTRLKHVPEAAQEATLTGEEAMRGSAFAQTLSVRILARAWQILVQAIPEVQSASRPLAAAEMALVRLCYVADLPTPDEALRLLREDKNVTSSPAAGPSSVVSSPAAIAPRASFSVLNTPQRLAISSAPALEPAVSRPALARFTDLVALAEQHRDLVLKKSLERDIRLVHYEEGRIEFSLVEGASSSLPGTLGRVLEQWTGRRWMLVISSQPGEPSLYEREQEEVKKRKAGASDNPLVQSILAAFPGAEIVDVRDIALTLSDDTAPLSESEGMEDDMRDNMGEEGE